MNERHKLVLIWLIILVIGLAIAFGYWLGNRNETSNSLTDSTEPVTIEKSGEDILFQFTTTGELSKRFKPVYFLKVEGTDMSKCFTDNRLRINLNGEVYWIRLEGD